MDAGAGAGVVGQRRRVPPDRLQWCYYALPLLLLSLSAAAAAAYNIFLEDTNCPCCRSYISPFQKSLLITHSTLFLSSYGTGFFFLQCVDLFYFFFFVVEFFDFFFFVWEDNDCFSAVARFFVFYLFC